MLLIDSTKEAQSAAIASLAFHPLIPLLAVACGREIRLYNWRKETLIAQGTTFEGEVMRREMNTNASKTTLHFRYVKFSDCGAFLYTAVTEAANDSGRNNPPSRLRTNAQPRLNRTTLREGGGFTRYYGFNPITPRQQPSVVPAKLAKHFEEL